MTNAVIYTRVSSKAQEDGYSLETQLKDCEAYCAAKGYHVVAVESDTFTGHDSLDERDGMQRAIRLIKQGGAEVLVVWKIDRAGRFQLDNLLLNQDVTRAGGRLESLAEGSVANTALGKFILNAHSFVAESEWEDIKLRTQRGRDQRVDKGRILVTDLPLYGYRFAGERKDTYETNPETAPVVQDIFTKADSGWGTRRIAEYLNDKGIPTGTKLSWQRGELSTKKKYAEKWTAQRVGEILHELSYTGQHAARRYETVKTTEDGKTTTKKVLRAETDERRVAMTIPALVPVDQYNRIQDMLHTRNMGWSQANDTPEVTLLNKGIAICGMCGARMIRVHYTWKGQDLWCYACSMRSGVPSDKSKTCPGGSFMVRAAKADQDVWSKVTEIIRDKEKFNRLTKSRTAKLAEQHAQAAQRYQNADNELAEMRANQATVYQRYTYETDETIRAMHKVELQKLNDTIANLEKRVNEYQTYATATQQHQDAHAKLLEAVGQTVVQHRTEVDPDFAARIQRHVVNALTEMVEEIDLDSLSREEKRNIMQTLGVKVYMYPVTSEFAKTNAERWEFKFSEPTVQSQVPTYGGIREYSWLQWLSA